MPASLLPFLIIAIIIGAMIGSFLTAWIWRIHEGRSMMERHSICPHCHHPLGPLDLFPILSYLALRGHCRYCHTRISPQYILIEIATAALFTATAYQVASCRLQVAAAPLIPATCNLQPWMLFSVLIAWAIIALLVALFVYDLKWGELPNQWTLGGSAVALVGTIVAWIFHQPMLWQPGQYDVWGMKYDVLNSLHTSYFILHAIAPGLAAALFFLLIVWGSEKILHKPGMGMGDVKLALLMGLFLGFPGIIVALYLAFIFGAVLSLLLLAGKRKKVDAAIPFGPFLVSGTLAALWLTPVIVNWYERLII